MKAIFPMDYIKDKTLFAAVMFARNMIRDGEPASKANWVAAHYYHRPVSDVAHYTGQCGGRIKAIRSKNRVRRNPFSGQEATIKKWKLEYAGKIIEGSSGRIIWARSEENGRGRG